jgi:signal peptidase I
MEKRNVERPTLDQLNRELERRKSRNTYKHTFRGLLWILIVVAAAAVLCSSLFLSVLKIQGSSMEPTFREGEIVLALKTHRFRRGDIMAFYFDNRILLKRVIANAGEWVNIDTSGNVSINGKKIAEPYVQNKSREKCDISLPYQVPDGRWFVMGDHRSRSIDSRTTTIGPVSKEQTVGKVVLCIWPLKHFGIPEKS